LLGRPAAPQPLLRPGSPAADSMVPHVGALPNLQPPLLHSASHVLSRNRRSPRAHVLRFMGASPHTSGPSKRSTYPVFLPCRSSFSPQETAAKKRHSFPPEVH
jgi:hypothetical protein